MEEKRSFRFLLDMFTTFFKIGSFTFGGGFAMIPLIEREVITKKKWVTEEEVLDVFAISQSLPGAIAINSSSFIGYKIAGRKGALVATAGVVLPSFLIITIIAAFFTRFQDNSIVNAVFYGIRPTIVALILMAAFKMAKSSVKDKTGALILALSVVLVVFFDIHAVLIIIGGACIGLVIYYSSPKTVSRIMGNGGKKDGLS